MAIEQEYRPIVKKAALTAGAIGAPGALSFGLDVAAMSGIWTTMTLAIAKQSGHKIDKSFAAKLVSALLAGIATYIGGSKLVVKLLHLFPGAGTLGAVGVNSLVNFWFTWRVGKALATLFDRGDFTAREIREVVVYLLTIVKPLPSPNELLEVVSLMTDTSA